MFRRSSTQHSADLQPSIQPPFELRKLRDLAPHRLIVGVVLYDGAETIRFDDRVCGAVAEAVVGYAQGRHLNASGIAPDGSSAGICAFRIRQNTGRRGFGIRRRNSDRLATNHDVDRDRIFASGHSSGCFFTLSLMEHRADVLTGFAVVGAYARYKVMLAPGANPLLNSSATLLALSLPADRAETPRPVYYLFGKQDSAFNNDSPDQLIGWSQTGKFARTLDLESAARS